MKALRATTMITEFQQFIDAGVFSPAEIHAAEKIVNASIKDNAPTFLDYWSIAIAVWAPVNGHVCINLDNVTTQVLDELGTEKEELNIEDQKNLQWPDVSEWSQHLKQSPLVDSSPSLDNSKVDYTRPLVLFGRHLYLTRQWVDEGIVAQTMKSRLTENSQNLPPKTHTWIEQVLGKDADLRQKTAVEFALRHQTMVLLGGPGTGKTHTIAAILHAIFSHHADLGSAKPLRVAIAAPTAKAARQVTKSIKNSIDSKANPFPKTHSDQIATAAEISSTIHRLLGWTPISRGRFKHNQTNFLPYDVVVVDEVSMVSLPLMARLLEALEPQTKLILVGDPQQLKSVEAGSVLPDIAELESDNRYPIVELTKNWRQFDPLNPNKKSPIAELAAIVREAKQGSENEVVDFLKNQTVDVRFIALDNDKPDPTSKRLVLEKIKNHLQGYLDAKQFAEDDKPSDALKALASVRVLCGHRRGIYGVASWNRLVSDEVGVDQYRGAIGQPLLNTRNEIRTGLANGDTGIVVRSKYGRRAYFEVRSRVVDDEGTEESSNTVLDAFEPTSLESVETAFATTIHKAQGSEYETVIVILPPVGSPLLKRELLYTAITRARKNLIVVATEDAIKSAMINSINRVSGLAHRIRQ
jgi:exodeoxyribonuclease V alpha subunit